MISKKEVKHIEVLSDQVYIEYIDFDSSYVSFNKAKKLIKKQGMEEIHYNCADCTRSVNFINSIPFYTLSEKENYIKRNTKPSTRRLR